jgi:hypothetical protein
MVALEYGAGNVGSEVEIASGSVLLQNSSLPVPRNYSLNVEGEQAYFGARVRYKILALGSRPGEARALSSQITGTDTKIDCSSAQYIPFSMDRFLLTKLD